MSPDRQKQADEQNSLNISGAGRQSLRNEPSGRSTGQPASQIDPNDYLVELKYRNPQNVGTAKLAKGLAMFSIALGLAEVLAPGKVGQLIGVGDRHRSYLPVLGLREIAHGVGILAQTKPTEAVWTRVGGDAIDLAFLGAAFMSDETNKTRLTGAALAVLGVAALDVLCAKQLTTQTWSDAAGNIKAPTTVGQPSARHAPVM